MNYSRFLTPKSLARKPSAIRALQKYLTRPGMISLGGGNPNPATFPFTEMQVTLQDGRRLDLTPGLSLGLQYSPTNGLPELVEWLRQLQQKEHKPQRDIDICIGNGSQDVLTKAFDMLLDSDDTLLIEAPAYSGSLAFLRPLGCRFLEVPVDCDGLIPEALEQALVSCNNNKPPKVLYSVPTGGNPTGLSTNFARKQHIYEIARKYDLLILEDDPYYFLQRIPSYLSIDTDGRVLRFDSFSKILSAGIRIGWVSGPKELVDRIVLNSQTTLLHPSGISQLMVLALLKDWGFQGFYQHVDKVSLFYKEKRNIFLQMAEKHLKGLAEWQVPQAGMFVWLKLLGIDDSARLVKEKAIERNILLVPGFVPFYF